MNVSHEHLNFPIPRHVKLNLHNSKFSSLFKIDHITLPIYQRKYCWIHKQFEAWWNDLLHLHTNSNKEQHTIGKFVLFEKKNEVIVVDGQQRITTVLIMLCSMRDYFEQKLIQEKQNNQNKNEKRKQSLRKSIFTINRILFNNLPKKMNNKETTNSDDDDSKENEIEFEIQKVQLYHHLFRKRHSMINEGHRLDFIRFLPTWLDRKYLYDLVLQTNALNQYKNDMKLNSDALNIKVFNSKIFFDNKLKELWNNESLVKSLYNKVLTHFKFVYVGMPESEIEKAYHVYQWAYENQLLAEKVLTNHRPGQKHRCSELFKNYILSFFLAKEMGEKERIYRIWIEIEKSFDSLDAFDEYLISKLKAKNLFEAYGTYRECIKPLESLLKDVNDSNMYCDIVEKFLISLKPENQIEINRKEIEKKLNSDNAKEKNALLLTILDEDNEADVNERDEQKMKSIFKEIKVINKK